ncbi:TPA: DUF4198 domain-containing protein [Candidatus Poribacteria bacterium]|nr:DUF4198 domain-containing protein [Candidatus Poribacteria bacterium]
MRKLMAIMLFSIIIASSVSAHTLWVQSTRYYIESGGESGTKATMFFGWGHRIPLDDPIAAEKIKLVELYEPDGKVTAITISDGRSFHCTPIEYSKEGTYVLSAETNPGYYTMYLNKSRKMRHYVGPMDEVTDATKIVLSLYVHQYPKSIITSVKSSGKELKPVGNQFEIVPEIEPANLKTGSRFSFLVYFDGKVLEKGEAKYSATYMGYSTEPEKFLYNEREVVNGRGDFDISRPGIWFVEAKYDVPAPESLKNKCKTIHYKASLTFAVEERVRNK